MLQLNSTVKVPLIKPGALKLQVFLLKKEKKKAMHYHGCSATAAQCKPSVGHTVSFTVSSEAGDGF